jgi:CheY-like chemotaxis protein
MESSYPCILIVDEALSTLTKRTVEAVVSDYNMPGANGLELAALIRQQYPHIPVFILSNATALVLEMYMARFGFEILLAADADEAARSCHNSH